MKNLFSIFIVFLALSLYAGDSLEINKLPGRYKNKYAVFTAADFKNRIAGNAFNLPDLPNKVFVLLSVQALYDNKTAELKEDLKDDKEVIKENRALPAFMQTAERKASLDTFIEIQKKYAIEKKAKLDSLGKILKAGKSIYLNAADSGVITSLLKYYGITQLFRKGKIALFQETGEHSLLRLKYKSRKIGATRHFKLKKSHKEFYHYYALDGTGSIYQSCLDGSSTALGRFIMFFQRIGW